MRGLFTAIMVMSLYSGGLTGGGIVGSIIDGQMSRTNLRFTGLGLIGLLFVFQILVALRRRGILR
jgi:hypothetical protein